VSHARAYVVAAALSTASVLVACAPSWQRWRWHAALFLVGLLVALW
jgi:hypothetical protein